MVMIMVVFMCEMIVFFVVWLDMCIKQDVLIDKLLYVGMGVVGDKFYCVVIVNFGVGNQCIFDM